MAGLMVMDVELGKSGRKYSELDERSIGFRVRAGSLSTSTQLNYEGTHTFSLRLGGMKRFWDAWRSLGCTREYGTDREE